MKATATKTGHKNEIGDRRTAGITRSELFERTASRQPIRLHDLRATFVTVSLANGKTEQWVMDRTGHKSSQMIALYARQARTWAELNLGPLLPLDTLFPEMRRGTSQLGPSTRPASHPASRRGRKLERATSGPQIAPAVGLEPTTRRLTEEGGESQSEELRALIASGQSRTGNDDPARFTVRHNQSSRNVSEIDVERIIQRGDGERGSNVTPTDVDRAIRDIIKLALDAGDYERAAALLDVARRSTPKERA